MGLLPQKACGGSVAIGLHHPTVRIDREKAEELLNQSRRSRRDWRSGVETGSQSGKRWLGDRIRAMECGPSICRSDQRRRYIECRTVARLTVEHLCWVIAVGWLAPDQTVDANIARGPRLNVNAWWATVLWTVPRTHVNCWMESLAFWKKPPSPKGGAMNTTRFWNWLVDGRDHQGDGFRTVWSADQIDGVEREKLWTGRKIKI